MARRNFQSDSEDLFADTRMSFGDHIEELRIHLWKAVGGFIVAMILSFFIGQNLLLWMVAPVEAELNAFYDRREKDKEKELEEGNKELLKNNEPLEVSMQFRQKDLAEMLNLPAPPPGQPPDTVETWKSMNVRVHPVELALALGKAQRLVGRKPGVVNTTVMDGMNIWFKLCMVSGFVIGSPWIFYQIWLFISAGLYPHEKKLVHYYLPFSLVLFLAGVFLCEEFVIPSALRILLEFNAWVGGEPQLHMAEWINFALMMPVIFGLSFQTPLVMLGLAKIGIFDSTTFKKKRRIAWFVLAVLAAVITPTPDLVNMSLMWIPMCFLYELGIILSARAEKRSGQDIPEPEEMVGV